MTRSNTFSIALALLFAAPQLALAEKPEEAAAEENVAEAAETTDEEVEIVVDEEEASPTTGGGFTFDEQQLSWAGEAAVTIPTRSVDAGLGIGGFLRAEYRFKRDLRFTGRVGTILHLFDSNYTLIEVPVLVGARFFVQPQIYIYGELGLSLVRVSASSGVYTASDTSLQVPLGFGGGYQINKQLDVRGEIFFSRFFDGFELMVAAGYTFMGV